jgi:hypothetical protein
MDAAYVASERQHLRMLARTSDPRLARRARFYLRLEMLAWATFLLAGVLLLPILVVTVGLACAHEARTPESRAGSREVWGCYRFALQQPLNTWPIPDVVELRPEQTSGSVAARSSEMRAYSTRELPPFLHGHWSRRDARSIALQWGNDFSGINATLEASGSGFSGRATTFRDVGDESETSELRLFFVECPRSAAQPAVAPDGASPWR